MNVIVLGASDNPARYSYKATDRLMKNGHTVYPVGIKDAGLFGLKIITSKEPISDIHTITMYLSRSKQKAWYEFIFSCNPERIIFNPGAENEELKKMAEEKGIEVVEDCTLIMLGQEIF